MNVITKKCVVCKQNGMLEDVDALGFLMWSEMGEDILKALPDLDADQRELLMTGTHAHCWEKMWGPDDDAA
jgi:hypothetical protein